MSSRAVSGPPEIARNPPWRSTRNRRRHPSGGRCRAGRSTRRDLRGSESHPRTRRRSRAGVGGPHARKRYRRRDGLYVRRVPGTASHLGRRSIDRQDRRAVPAHRLVPRPDLTSRRGSGESGHLDGRSGTDLDAGVLSGVGGLQSALGRGRRRRGGDIHAVRAQLRALSDRVRGDPHYPPRRLALLGVRRRRAAQRRHRARYVGRVRRGGRPPLRGRESTRTSSVPSSQSARSLLRLSPLAALPASGRASSPSAAPFFASRSRS